MTLEHKVSHLIGQWHGLDADERSDCREQLVKDLIELIRAEPVVTTLDVVDPAVPPGQIRAA